jgi:hypothetical protein
MRRAVLISAAVLAAVLVAACDASHRMREPYHEPAAASDSAPAQDQAPPAR